MQAKVHGYHHVHKIPKWTALFWGTLREMEVRIKNSFYHSAPSKCVYLRARVCVFVCVLAQTLIFGTGVNSLIELV